MWVEHQVGGPWAEDEVLLCQGDSSSASGWITRSSFGDECPLHLAIARTTANYMRYHGVHHYSQWFPGKENSVVDALSRDFWLGDEDVVDFIKQKFAHQIPQGFRLVQLSEAIVTDVGSLLRLLPKTQLSPLRPAPSGTAAGGDSRASSARSGISTSPFPHWTQALQTDRSPHVLRGRYQGRMDRRSSRQQATNVDEAFRTTSWT